MNQSQKNRGLVLRARTPRRFICFISGLFEGYDGLGVIRTIDKEKGLIEILSTKDQEEDLRALASQLSTEIELELLD